MEQPVIKLLFVSDNPNVASEVDPALADAPNIQVLGTTATEAGVVELIKRQQPDIVVVDYDMLGIDAAEVTRAVHREDDTIQVIMLSVVNNAEDIRAAMRAGARDYLVTPLKAGELVETARWLINERREYARMQAFVTQLRRAYEALFTDDKVVPPTVVEFLEKQAALKPNDRLTQETLAVAYARNRDWQKLAPLAAKLADERWPA
ncbi:MAG TPA: response regulator [Aggregatilineales bacterium]|nr:response regulator [Aggregatilineales bacterium]HPV05588.1 response regulator [Aggregatilineales bacterium]HQA67787.1 response regulator [Aggregatilineales bacterium]HQE17333.1 response regulator [Aggregatilineales bacterium]